MDLKDFSMEDVLAWLKKLEIGSESFKIIEELKWIGEELADAEADELIDEGVSKDDAKRIVNAVKNFKPNEETQANSKSSVPAAAAKKVDLELIKLKMELKTAETNYKKLGTLKKLMASITMPVGYILQFKEELKCLPEEKKGPSQKKFTRFVKQRDDILKKLREARSEFPKDSENWRAIAEVHEGSMQVVSKNTNFNFGKMVTTHTSRIFREQRSAMAAVKDVKKKISELTTI